MACEFPHVLIILFGLTSQLIIFDIQFDTVNLKPSSPLQSKA